jgi:hypothetical protein
MRMGRRLVSVRLSGKYRMEWEGTHSDKYWQTISNLLTSTPTLPASIQDPIPGWQEGGNTRCGLRTESGQREGF